MSERIGRGDRRAAGSKARRPAAYPGNREAQISDRQTAADAIRPLFGATAPANRAARIAAREAGSRRSPRDQHGCGRRPATSDPGRRPAKAQALPDHLPRHAIVHEPVHGGACTCPACGGDMVRLGEDVSEVLDYIPGRFRVIRHVRPEIRLPALRRYYPSASASDAVATGSRRPPACWRICWSQSIAIICRSTRRVRSMPATASTSTARP